MSPYLDIIWAVLVTMFGWLTIIGTLTVTIVYILVWKIYERYSPSANQSDSNKKKP